MKAISLDGINLPLTITNVSKPKLKANEALVQLKMAALNRRDYWIHKGLYAGLKFPIIIGSDGAGIVEDVKSEDGAGWLGKEVIINPSINWGSSERAQGSGFHILGLPENGTFAEYVNVPIENLFPLPPHLTFEEAAALPLGGLTAWRALFSRAKLAKGERVLITGIGGGVASMALQFAIQMGAEVYVTSGKRAKLKKAIELGALGGALYTDKHWKEKLNEIGGFDVILDSASGAEFAHYIDLTRPGGRIVFYGATVSGNIPDLNARKIFWKQLSILGTTMGSSKDFMAMLDFVNQYKIKPIIDSVLPMAHIEEAMQKMECNEHFGKLVLRVH